MLDLDFDDIKQRSDETTQQWVYRALRFIIMSGQVTPGQALTIRGLAADLDVSAMPIREALRRLTSEGALTLKSNRRIVVPQLSSARLLELLELRVSLETLAASRAAPFIDDALIEELSAVDDALNAALQKGQVTQIILLNQHFHKLLYSANPHDVTLPLIERVWLQMGPLHRLALLWLRDNVIDDRHIDILDALKSGSTKQLTRAIAVDIREAAGYMTQKELLDGSLTKNLDNLTADFSANLRQVRTQ